MASQPADANMFMVDNYASLSGINSQLLSMVCRGWNKFAFISSLLIDEIDYFIILKTPFCYTYKDKRHPRSDVCAAISKSNYKIHIHKNLCYDDIIFRAD